MKKEGVIFRSFSAYPQPVRPVLRLVEQKQATKKLVSSLVVVLFFPLVVLFLPFFHQSSVSSAQTVAVQARIAALAEPTQPPLATPTPVDIHQVSEPSPTPTPQVTKAPAKPILQKIVPVVMAAEAGNVSYIIPVATIKLITTYFSSWHPGVDLATDYGTPVFAAADGVVIESGWSTVGYGNTIVLEHADTSTTRYAHLSKILVSVGDHVAKGATIGNVGCTGNCTGPHLHFEIHKNGVAINPLSVIAF